MQNATAKGTKMKQPMTWEQAVEAKVALGWTREQAEAMTPMGVAEARRRGLVIHRYQSPMAALFTRSTGGTK